ncbi:DoxX family protein [Brevibacillus porteri]|uniref:DoxX family protein n=1 Tax=Brevibacillus porteri TaxID=2126350 RepID=A0ABX5FJ66_9BACL|nr:DoxX family protein [Brevibacillus porteri]MED1798539.1 DoxX family protein [Brevibacillus porteri]MED2134343.1 DoxX family protein [Brevibacillus porteri]MED2746795.1 DoxX family protein [Brevibacillus porteri]MED2818083.1 DoxX family protein [Brevibacillus porteri]MED2897668.1 DoxX family protein [Brevibacillus porteri]
MNTFIMILSLMLALMFSISLLLKFLRASSMLQHWKEYGYPLWFMDVIASLELVGVIGVISSFWFPRVLTLACILFAILMLGAIHAHLFRAKHEPVMALNAVFMLICSLLLLWL